MSGQIAEKVLLSAMWIVPLLYGGITNDNGRPNPVPTWFHPYENDFSRSPSCRLSVPFKSRRKTPIHEPLGSPAAHPSC